MSIRSISGCCIMIAAKRSNRTNFMPDYCYELNCESKDMIVWHLFNVKARDAGLSLYDVYYGKGSWPLLRILYRRRSIPTVPPTAVPKNVPLAESPAFADSSPFLYSIHDPFAGLSYSMHCGIPCLMALKPASPRLIANPLAQTPPQLFEWLVSIMLVA